MSATGVMPSDLIQGQGQGHSGPKVEKMADFKVFASANMHVIKRPNGEF